MGYAVDGSAEAELKWERVSAPVMRLLCADFPEDTAAALLKVLGRGLYSFPFPLNLS
jgi:hypothetical protein